MNVPNIALTLGTQLRRNLKPLATVATVATPATALRGGVLRRCHLIKEVATGGNTNPLLNISRLYLPLRGASLLPVKNQRQQNLVCDYAGKPRNPVLLPLLPVFLKPDVHVYVCFHGAGLRNEPAFWTVYRAGESARATFCSDGNRGAYGSYTSRAPGAAPATENRARTGKR